MIIVYNSMTGTTKKYALGLAQKLECEAVFWNEAQNVADEVIFMSWIQMGQITLLKEAREKFKLKAVIAVGAMLFSDDAENETKQKNNVDEEFFLLPGAFSLNKLNGMYKMMMKMAFSMMKKELKNNPAAEKFNQIINEGIDMYDESKFDEIVEKLK